MVKIYKYLVQNDIMKIICLEGCSGSGKTTQFHLLNNHFSSSQYKSLGIVEKDYEPFKSAVQSWHKEKGPAIPFTEEDIKFFARARAETFKRNFYPLANEINLLIFDRYLYTSAVYQRNCGLSPIEILNINLKYGAPIPDRTFLFDCGPTIAFIRAEKRNKLTGGKHLFSTSPKKIAEIRDVYLDLASRRDEMEIMDTNNSIGHVTKNLISRIETLF